MMEQLQQFLSIEIWQGKTIGDYLSLEFLASLFGSVLAVILILIVGWIIAAWLGRRMADVGNRSKHLDNTLFNFLG